MLTYFYIKSYFVSVRITNFINCCPRCIFCIVSDLNVIILLLRIWEAVFKKVDFLYQKFVSFCMKYLLAHLFQPYLEQTTLVQILTIHDNFKNQPFLDHSIPKMNWKRRILVLYQKIVQEICYVKNGHYRKFHIIHGFLNGVPKYFCSIRCLVDQSKKLVIRKWPKVKAIGQSRRFSVFDTIVSF